MKPKLLVITSTFPRWPSDTDPPFVFELSRRLVDSFDVTVHTPHYPGALTKEVMGRVHVHRFRYFLVPYERLAGGQGIVPKMRRNKLYCLLLPFFLCAQFFSLLLLAIQFRPDVIHAHWLIPQGLWAVLIKKMLKIPVFITAHGADVFSLRAPVSVKVKKWIVDNTDRIVTVSEALAEVLRSDTRRSLQPSIIPMGVDASVFSPHKRRESIREQYGINGPFLLFVGRLTEKKGVRFLIDAMSMVTTKCPEAKLLIVGHGELEQELRKQVNTCGLEKFVFFAGGMTNAQLPAYYATADIFIGPSVQVKGGDTEGFGLTFVEAMMSGCLAIGTRIGGIEDIIQDGDTGYLVTPADSNALAAKVVEVIGGIDQLDIMRVKARNATVDQFDWNLIATKYKDAYLSHL